MNIKKAALLMLVFAVLLPLTSCKKGISKKSGKTIQYHLAAEPVTLDPQVASDSPSITAIQALFEGLTRLDASGKAYPGVAEQWKHNDNYTRFTFTLRSDAQWSNKKYGSVTADDFVFAFRRALDPKTGSPTCTSLFCIRNAQKFHAGSVPAEDLGVTAKDKRTLVVDLTDSCPDFPKLAASAPFMPCCENFFDSTAGRYGLESKYLLGNGPFAIDGTYGWDHGKQLNLRRSSRYHGQKVPLPSAVDFSMGKKTVDVSDPVAALKNGTVDAIEVSSEQAVSAKESGCSLESFLNSTWGLCFNTKSELFQNEKIRRAFLQSLNRTAVLSHLPNNCSAAGNILLPGTTLNGYDYRSTAGGPFYLKQDANAARTLSEGLKETGLSKMKSFAVLCPDDSSIKLILNEMISSWNSQFDTYFNMEPLKESELLSRVESGNFEAALYPVTPSGNNPLEVLSMFSSDSADNPAKLQDSAYDAIITDAQAKSGNAAVQAYAKAERYLNEHAVFYPLYYEKKYYALAKGVTGIVFHPYQGCIDFISATKE